MVTTFYQTGPNGLFIFYQVFNLILQSAQIYFIQLARQLMIDYVYFYDKELISNEKKLNNVVRAVVTSLEKKGFVVSENDVKNIIAGIEKIVTDLRLKQINS